MNKAGVNVMKPNILILLGYATLTQPTFYCALLHLPLLMKCSAPIAL